MTTALAAPPTQGWIADGSTFGARLALIRQRMSWGNLKEAASACGLPVQSWRHWERDNTEPRRLVAIARAIATTTGCDFLWLVHGPDRGGVGHGPPLRPTVIAVGEPRRQSTTRPVRQTRPTQLAHRRRPPVPVAV